MKTQCFELLEELIFYLEAALEWIDGVPSTAALPTMPGFDRDEVENLLVKARRYKDYENV
jgi:hypothetical protein